MKAATDATIDKGLPFVRLLNDAYKRVAPEGTRCPVSFVFALLGEADNQMAQIGREATARGIKVAACGRDSDHVAIRHSSA